MSYTSVSDREKIQVKKNSRAIYRAIKEIDENIGRSLLEHMDK